MDPVGLVQIFLSVCLCLSGAAGSPIGTTDVDCSMGSTKAFGPVDEGYTGDVEQLNGITAGSSVMLVPYLFPEHIKFLELSFTVGETSATVRTKKPLDADALANTASTLYYSVMCVGGGKLNNTRTLTVRDLNDNAPVFKQEEYHKTVAETFSVETQVLRVEATDADSTPAHNRVSYSILPPSSEDFILTDAGALMLKRPLNYNIVQKYNFTVEARDNGGLSDRATVLITVEDFDNLNPYFNHNLYQAFLPENQTGPFRTILPEEIKAQDGDTGINQTVVYSIAAVSPSRYQSNFNIDSSSGILTVPTAIDREDMDSAVISVSIKATQADDGFKTAAALVSVNVEDVNDNAPEFDQPHYAVTLLENSPLDAVVLRAVVTDPDQGGFTGTLRILPESAPFSVSSDGTVKVKNSVALDREATESFIFQIEAKEASPPHHVVMADVNVTLLDVNDNSPTFNSSKYEVTVTDQSEGMMLVQVKAEDPDAGANGQIKYSINFGNKDGYFSIHENTGEITLVQPIPLLENTILELSLYVTARDGGVPSHSSSVQVDILVPGYSKPQFTQSTYSGTIEEEQDGGVVILRVNFLAIATEVPVTLQVETETDKFAIDNDGVFTSRVKLDYDEAPHNYSVAISISDGLSTDNAVVEVKVTDINDNSPVFALDGITNFIPEDTEVGVNLTSNTATDKDSGFNRELRFSLQGGEGKFSIEPMSGIVSVAAALDRETKAKFRLVVVAEDQGRPARSATVTSTVIVTDVNDNAPMFSMAEYEAEVSETESVGTSLLTLSAVDRDEGANGTVTYSIFQESPSSESAVFQLDPSTGVLRLAQNLDYSEVKVYSLMVQATDGGAPSLVGNGSVVVRVKDVNNNPPKFSKETYDVAVTENLASGSSILTLEVTDRDEGGFSRGHFLYTTDTFDINKQGVVSLKKNVTLDRETKDSYILQVVAVDQPTDSLSSTAQLNITVLDYNDNSPQFQALPGLLQVPEGNYSDQTPWEVYTILATDADLGANGEVTVSFLSAHPLFRFREDGTLLVVGLLDRESRDTFDLVIEASDKGRPQRENITSIRLSVTDVNDNAPVFSADSYEAEVSETESVGTSLLTLSAVDRDKGANGTVTYSIFQESPSSESSVFQLDPSTGVLRLAQNLDYSEVKVYSLMVQATDGGAPSLVGNGSVVVRVKDVNNNPPKFSKETYDVAVTENLASGSSILTLEVTDRDEGGFSRGHFLYTTDTFDINKQGVVSLKKNVTLDRETTESYILQVVAVDQPTDSLSSTAQLNITVLDYNDNSPQFQALPGLLQVPEGNYSDQTPWEVYTILATDADLGANGEVTVSFLSPHPLFRFREDGTLLVVGVLDRESRDTFDLVIKASDKGRPQRENITSIRLSVTDVNDNAPVFSADSYEAEVSETESVGTSLLTLSAVDRDEGANGTVTYSIFHESPSSESAVFQLDPSTGVLRLAQNLDYSEVKVYCLMVQATDGGVPSLVGNGSVVVRVKDVNNNPPKFSKETYDVAVTENLASGSSILTLEVTDRDEGGFSRGHFLYTTDTFDINKQGVVSLKKNITLDRETTDSYILQVVAVDQPTDSLSSTAQLNITVLDYNDNSPQFQALPGLLQVPEGNYSDQTPWEVYTILATDADLGANGEVTVSFPSPHPLFRFREDGTLLVVGVLDHESRDTFDLVIKASDKGRPQRENITTVRLSVTDVNDNAPVFSADNYTTSILVNDAAEGQLLLMLAATDKDTGNNSLITYSFSAGGSPYLALNSETGAVTLTSDLADVTEDTALELTATAEDNGRPPLSSTAVVVIKLRTASMVEGVAFHSSFYNFSLPENQPARAMVGAVKATSGSVLHNVAYTLKTHTDLFSVNASGALMATVTLDKESQEWYILEVEAVDTRAPPTSATTLVGVQVEDVNEVPHFTTETYKASIFSIAPYKSPIVHVKATDPDVGDKGRLVYSLSAASGGFDVDASTGLVYVVSAAGLAGQLTTVDVKATDPKGLYATAKVEVEVKGSATSSNVVVVSLNRAANLVEKKVPEVEKSLGKVLGWTVRVIGVSSANGGTSVSRSPSRAAETFISFIALDGGEVVSSEEVTKKLQSESAMVKAELEKVLGEGLQLDVEEEPKEPTPDQAIVIALGVLLGLSVLGLVLMVTFSIVWFRRMKNRLEDQCMEDFDIDKQSEEYGQENF